ncbi:MAG: galactose mutarotase [Acidobacteria bacterium]|nr:galactose mutarotase [Acidobacteriota bacterium]
MHRTVTITCLAAAVFCAACARKPATAPQGTPQGENGSVTKQEFGKTAQGQPVDLYILKNKNGVEAAITNYGGIVVSLKTPDAKGQFADIALGFDNLQGYLGEHPYFGAIVGRYGNRIAHGKFSLNGKTYTLARNNGENSLHGGLKGFDKKVWSAQAETRPEGQVLTLKYRSVDGEEGYPGNLDVTVVYTLTPDNDLRIDNAATTDQDTVLNVTNHTYFNLAGQGKGDILGQQIAINSSRITPVDAGLIPTGELKPVAGTPFDFRNPKAIGKDIAADDLQLKLGKGYDHNFVLDRKDEGLAPAAEVTDPVSGRVLQVWTTEPATQFYTGNFLDGTVKGKGGVAYQQRYGFCLETQHYPDSPNHPAFPTTTLKAGQQYKSTTVWKFRTAAAQ